jgi:hypothetical protein
VKEENRKKFVWTDGRKEGRRLNSFRIWCRTRSQNKLLQRKAVERRKKENFFASSRILKIEERVDTGSQFTKLLPGWVSKECFLRPFCII